jgi:hypothetical protein
MAEGQVLHNAVDIGGAEHSGCAQGTAPLGTFVLEQMALARTSAHDFAAGGDFKSFGHCFPGFDTFRASHRAWHSWLCAQANFWAHAAASNAHFAERGCGRSRSRSVSGVANL